MCCAMRGSAYSERSAKVGLTFMSQGAGRIGERGTRLPPTTTVKTS